VNLAELAEEIVKYREKNPKMYEKYLKDPKYGFLLKIAEIVAAFKQNFT